MYICIYHVNMVSPDNKLKGGINLGVFTSPGYTGEGRPFESFKVETSFIHCVWRQSSDFSR